MFRETAEKIIKKAEKKGFEIGVQIGIRHGVDVVQFEIAKMLLEYEKMTMKEDSEKRQQSVKKINKRKKSGL